MSVIKSFSVGNGDMFYINHNSDSFSIIDCCMCDSDEVKIVNELKQEGSGKVITRFLSTHPDDDHIRGLEYLDKQMSIVNFYCVKNEVIKTDPTTDFEKYCELRDSGKAFYIQKGSTRKWLNASDNDRGSAGITILWPVVENQYYKDVLQAAKNGGSPNNLSPIIQYKLEDGVTIIWMGDLETDFMENIKDDLDLPKVHILFAPHHGRNSGTIPSNLLEKMNPDIIIIGEADSEHLNYYQSYNTLTQNSTGDITLDCVTKKVHIYVSEKYYSVDFLDYENMNTFDNYIGTLNL